MFISTNILRLTRFTSMWMWYLLLLFILVKWKLFNAALTIFLFVLHLIVWYTTVTIPFGFSLLSKERQTSFMLTSFLNDARVASLERILIWFSKFVLSLYCAYRRTWYFSLHIVAVVKVVVGELLKLIFAVIFLPHWSPVLCFSIVKWIHTFNSLAEILTPFTEFVALKRVFLFRRAEHLVWYIALKSSCLYITFFRHVVIPCVHVKWIS